MSPEEPLKRRLQESDDSESSAASEQSEGDEAHSEQSEPELLENFEWFGQEAKGRRSIIHIVEDFPPGGVPIPFCREAAFSSWPQEMGWGARDMQACGYDVCPSCQRKAKANEVAIPRP